MTSAPLGELVDIRGGGTPRRDNPAYWNGNIPWATVKDFKTTEILKTLETISEPGVKESATSVIPAGNIIVPTRMALGKVAINRIDLAINQDLKALLIHDRKRVDGEYLFRFLLSKSAYIEGQGKGATVKGITLDVLRELEVPLPSLAEQNRIAAILDKADAIQRKRKQAIQLADEFLRSVFLDMFGDPFANQKGWLRRSLGSVSELFSDGPFGSNLKTSDYVDEGVRVVRLRNIGVGEFLDEDKAFISDEHFRTLAKHECLPGDIMIGTLGDPNLRACVLPEYVERALNKADCIQLRPNNKIATAEFLTALINHPGTLALASHLLHGQTRVRISMGTLRQLTVPIPPIEEQKQFSKIAEKVRATVNRQKDCLDEANISFQSIAQRAFRGGL